MTQLQSAVNAVRAAAGLAAYAFAAVSPGGGIRAADVEDLRSALDPARSALNLTVVAYSRRPLASPMMIRADDVNETRGGVQ